MRIGNTTIDKVCANCIYYNAVIRKCARQQKMVINPETRTCVLWRGKV